MSNRFWPPEIENMRHLTHFKGNFWLKIEKSKNSKWPPKPEVMQMLKRIAEYYCV